MMVGGQGQLAVGPRSNKVGLSGTEWTMSAVYGIPMRTYLDSPPPCHASTQHPCTIRA